jgi:GntR family transcriptional repressor for pyruvate dehydrogenase complex
MAHGIPDSSLKGASLMEDSHRPFTALDRPETLSDRVTTAMLAHIAQAALKPGDRLPSERELGQQFNVSRTVVREAMRSLAAKGVLDIRSGSRAIVAKVDAKRAGEALRLYVQGLNVGVDGVTYEQINDVRSVIESKVSELAAVTATQADIAQLEAIHRDFGKELHNPEAASMLDVAFHRTIAVSVHNPLFVLMLDSIEPVLIEIRRRTLGVPGRPEKAVEAHGLILERIQQHDQEGAAAAMNAHLEEARAAWRSLPRSGGAITVD